MAETEETPGILTGIWVSPEGEVHLHYREGDTVTEKQDTYEGFGWAREESIQGIEVDGTLEELNGNGPFNRLLSTPDFGTFKLWQSKDSPISGFEVIKPFESQYLLQHQLRLFDNLRFMDLKRCQLDIETDSTEGHFSNPYGDRVLAIGLKMGDKTELLCLERDDREAEEALLRQFNDVLLEWDPDVIEGHNIFSFDLNYLKIRFKKYKLPCKWGRFGQEAKFRKSRLKVAERWIDFDRCDLPGRTVFDSYLMVQLFDLTARDMSSYGLKQVAQYFGVTQEMAHERTYLDGHKIHEAWREDRESFLAYLNDDLLETEGVCDILLPTYFEQTKSFPVLLQEACLRGTSSKVDMLFYEKYYHARHALPDPVEQFAMFEGGFTKSFETGVFPKVLHYDVASLYPSLLLKINRNPYQDDLGVFLPILTELREYRLKYKKLARTEDSEALRQEYGARQASYKILINSFYGYLGFPGARFGDPELAAQVTAEGRELLQQVIELLEKEGAKPLEADTDGIYVTSEAFFDKPEVLLEKVQVGLPEGIELEIGGVYESMLCYKAKNYGLFDGEKVTIRGSALRSRGTEPYLHNLTRVLIHYLLGASDESPQKVIAQHRDKIEKQKESVEILAKTEFVNQSPAKYLKAAEEGNKPRRAALEIAARMTPPLKMGDRVTFYIGSKEKGKSAMWQRAYAIQDYDPNEFPYDIKLYLKKLDEWEKKYEDLIQFSDVK